MRFSWLFILFVALACACTEPHSATGIQVFVTTDYGTDVVHEVRVTVSGPSRQFKLPRSKSLSFYLRPTGELDATVRLQLSGHDGKGALTTGVHTFDVSFEPGKQTLVYLALDTSCPRDGTRVVEGPLEAWTGSPPDDETAAKGVHCEMSMPIDEADAGVDASAEEPLSGWAVRGGGELTDGIRSVATDAHGNVFAAGGFKGAATIGERSLTSFDDIDSYLTMFDASGQQRWLKQLGGNSNQVAEAVVIGSEGEVIITGWSVGTLFLDEQTPIVSTSDDIFVAAYESQPAGETPRLRWYNTFSGAARQAGKAMAVGTDGDIYLVGELASPMDAAHGLCHVAIESGDYGLFVARLDHDSGECLAIRSFSTTQKGCVGAQVAVAPKGDVVAGCSYDLGGAIKMPDGDATYQFPANNGKSAFVVHLDSELNIRWGRAFGVGASCSEPIISLRGLAVKPDGEVLVAGTRTRCLAVDGPDYARTLIPERQPTIDQYDYPFVLRIAESGEVLPEPFVGIPVQTENAGGQVRLSGISVDATGGFVTTGQINAAQFDFGAGLIEPTRHGGADAWVARYSADGQLTWLDFFGGSWDDEGIATAIDSEGRAVVACEFRGTAQPHGTNEITSAGDRDACVVRYGE